jgi:hypothetical protein
MWCCRPRCPDTRESIRTTPREPSTVRRMPSLRTAVPTTDGMRHSRETMPTRAQSLIHGSASWVKTLAWDKMCIMNSHVWRDRVCTSLTISGESHSPRCFFYLSHKFIRSDDVGRTLRHVHSFLVKPSPAVTSWRITQRGGDLWQLLPTTTSCPTTFWPAMPSVPQSMTGKIASSTKIQR